MDINISCEECDDDLEIVREFTQRGIVEITVKPCFYCLEKAAQQPVAHDPSVQEAKWDILQYLESKLDVTLEEANDFIRFLQDRLSV